MVILCGNDSKYVIYVLSTPLVSVFVLYTHHFDVFVLAIASGAAIALAVSLSYMNLEEWFG